MLHNSINGAKRRETATHRRLFLKGLAALPLAVPFASARATSSAGSCELKFRHTHTEERLNVVFRDSRGYVDSAIARLNWLLRDFRTGQMASMDPRLFDILHALSLTCGGDVFEIISAYRSPATNAKLRKTGGGGVARHSLHMEARAIDLRLVGFDTARLREAAVALGFGGVGYYPESDFVHVDTGNVRTWGPEPT